MPASRPWLVPLALLLGAGPVGPAPSAAQPGPGGFMSANVSWVATVPLDAPAIGARVLQVGAQRRFYVTGAKGLTIYDVTAPATPVVVGELALPHFENESVAVSDDGSTVILASDPSFGQPPVTYVIDTSVVTTPVLVGVIPRGSHTATCANPACTHVYGSDGWIYDIRVRDAPREVTPGWGGSAHYLSRDASGLLSTGRTLLDPRRDPARPRRINARTGGWHNSLRPNAERWRPRRAGDRSPLLRPGELHIGGDETLFTGTCNERSAAVTTWSLVDFDKGRRARHVATIRPRNGNYADGNPAVNPSGCSSHWFDYRAGMLAAGWYENGIRFIEVNERTGAMAEAGYFQPVATEAWAAYWIDDTHVYSIDALRGIDILRFHRDLPRPSPAELAGSWRPSLFRPSAATERERFQCRLAGRRAAGGPDGA